MASNEFCYFRGVTVKLTTPTRAEIVGLDEDTLADLRKDLTYIDLRADHELHRLQKSSWMIHKLGEEEWLRQVEGLKARRKQVLLHEPEDGAPWMFSGLADKVCRTKYQQLERCYSLPEPNDYPWYNKPKFDPRHYQLRAVDELIAAAERGPAAVELATGAGKTLVMALIYRRLCLRTVVMCPSKNIARQTFKNFGRWFGESRVGLYGDGRKDVGRQVTVAIDDSLVRVEPGTPAWDWLSGAAVFIADESHLVPSNTLRKVCLELMALSPYRFFVSGTQLRQDGLQLLLEAITGPVLFRYSVREGVDEGFLAKPSFTMVRTTSDSTYGSRDILKMTRKHLFYNPNVVKVAAQLANRSVRLLNRPTLVLVEEVEQFTKLLPYLKHEAWFAHAPLSQDNRKKVPEKYQNSNPERLVEDFDAGKFPILFGTDCISVGTDIQSAGMIIRLKGGISEVSIRQDTGRGTRMTETKKSFDLVDFDVTNIPDLHRHAKSRAAVYQDIYPSFQWMDT